MQMITNYFATRTVVQGSTSQADAEGQHEELGPYRTNFAAREALAVHFSTGVALGVGKNATAVQKAFVPEYLGLLTEMAAYGSSDQFEAHGVRWTIRGRL